MKEAVSFKNLTVKYGNKWVIRNFSATIFQGEKIVFSGSSGAGKSTLMNCILGFVKYAEGSLNVFGKEVNPDHIAQIRKETSWLPQELSFDIQTCKALLYFPFEYEANKKNIPDREEVSSLLSELLLPADILERRVDEISGGQKQRLLLASVLLLKRPLLLLDEPTSALDDKSVAAVLQYINKNKNITVISSSHDPAWIKGMSRIIQLKNL